MSYQVTSTLCNEYILLITFQWWIRCNYIKTNQYVSVRSICVAIAICDDLWNVTLVKSVNQYIWTNLHWFGFVFVFCFFLGVHFVLIFGVDCIVLISCPLHCIGFFLFLLLLLFYFFGIRGKVALSVFMLQLCTCDQN